MFVASSIVIQLFRHFAYWHFTTFCIANCHFSNLCVINVNIWLVTAKRPQQQFKCNWRQACFDVSPWSVHTLCLTFQSIFSPPRDSLVWLLSVAVHSCNLMAHSTVYKNVMSKCTLTTPWYKRHQATHSRTPLQDLPTRSLCRKMGTSKVLAAQ